MSTATQKPMQKPESFAWMSDLDWLTSARDLCPDVEGHSVTIASRGRSVTLTSKSRAVIVARIGEVMREKMNGGRRE